MLINVLGPNLDPLLAFLNRRLFASQRPSADYSPHKQSFRPIRAIEAAGRRRQERQEQLGRGVHCKYLPETTVFGCWRCQTASITGRNVADRPKHCLADIAKFQDAVR